MENKKVQIGFTFTDEYGNEYSANSFVDVFEDLGEGPLDVIGRQLNTFLSQIGFARKNDNILMDSLSEKELNFLSDALCKYRGDDWRAEGICDESDD